MDYIETLQVICIILRVTKDIRKDNTIFNNMYKDF